LTASLELINLVPVEARAVAYLTTSLTEEIRMPIQRGKEKREREKKFPRVESSLVSLAGVFRTDDLHGPIIYFRATHEGRHRVMQIARATNEEFIGGTLSSE